MFKQVLFQSNNSSLFMLVLYARAKINNNNGSEKIEYVQLDCVTGGSACF